MTLLSALLALNMTMTSSTPVLSQASLMKETPAQHNQRMSWFREARFGVFIHWGLYAVPGGTWNGKDVPGAGEWLLNDGQIKVNDYQSLIHQFNPVKYDPKAWVKAIKAAGAKYIVITSKHHEGFGLWPSKEGDWNIASTPYKKDLLKPLAEACRAEGLKMCFYHSIMDWHHPDYLPRRSWDPRPEVKADFERYVTYMKAQLKELLTEYGPISLLWFDGEWEATWNHERGVDLYNYVRSIQPNIIVNNRVDVGRGGMAGFSDAGFAGDYGTPEQEIPANGLPGVDWESCMTMNDTWGFVTRDHNWKSAKTLVQNLVDCASKGGNYLLNVGPTAEGEIPSASLERLSRMGSWLKQNGASIYGTQASPFPRPLTWGRATTKGNRLFLHVFAPYPETIELPGFSADGVKAKFLGTTQTVSATSTARGLNLTLPQGAGDGELPIVIELTHKGKAKIVAVPITASQDGSISLTATDALVHGTTAKLESDKNAIGFWTNANDFLSWDFDVPAAGNFDIIADLACEEKSAGSAVSIVVGNAALEAKIFSTGSWATFKKVSLGTVNLSTGKQTLTVKPVKMPNGAVMNLRSVRLVPVR